MSNLLLRNARIVNRGTIREADILIEQGRIVRIGPSISPRGQVRELDAQGQHVIPGIIDDQVHFREPGLTHKATIGSESRAAVAGGVTSFMEMPNVVPASVTQALLEEKYQIAARTSAANYSFFMGTTNDNYDEVMRTDPRRVCGIKIFMGSSTGDMLVDSPSTLERIFANAPVLIATHCEDETRVRTRAEQFRQRWGDALAARHHPQIRDARACLMSSSMAVDLARRHGTRLHILHITTQDELALFSNAKPLKDKQITSEVCVHHLRFESRDYARYGNLIKCNPAVKSHAHRAALLPALLDDRLDVVATDHAPHTWAEKSQPYATAPSGVPLVQHSLNVMLEFFHQKKISLERIVEKMCHAPAVAFRVADRGFVEEGQWADLAVVDVQHRWQVDKSNVLYHCGWSPFEGHEFRGKVLTTLVNGEVVWHADRVVDGVCGKRLEFERG
jgi:dihydroorotase